MQAVILAAGRGTRMGKLTEEVPKPLLKISGRPIVEYTLRNLPDEISEIIFIIGYKGEMIKKHFGKKFGGKKITYAKQKELNGTGGAVWGIKELLGKKFLILYGDDLYHRKDLNKIIKNDLAILVRKTEKPVKLGAVEFDKSGNLKAIVEREATTGSYLWCGTCVLNKELFNYPLAKAKPGSEEFGLPQTFVQMLDKHQIKVAVADYWHPNNCYDDLAKAEEIVKRYFI